MEECLFLVYYRAYKKDRLLNDDCESFSPRPLWEHFAIFTAARTTS